MTSEKLPISVGVKLNIILLDSWAAIWMGKLALLLKVVLWIWLIKYSTLSLLFRLTEKIVFSVKLISPKLMSLLTVMLFSRIVSGAISKVPETNSLFSFTISVNSYVGRKLPTCVSLVEYSRLNKEPDPIFIVLLFEE